MRVGGHVSAAGGLVKSLQRGADIGADVVQFFISNPRSWAFRTPSAADAIAFRAELETRGTLAVVHASYLINLASPDEEIRRKSVDLLLDTMRSASLTGVPYVVLHTGSHRGEGMERLAGELIDSISAAAEACEGEVKLLLENTAGSGGTIGATLQELAWLMHEVGKRAAIGVCIDSQHLFAAGYDFSTPSLAIDLVKDIVNTIGSPEVAHLNDSKVPLGKGTDRHANLGEGLIGLTGLRNLMSQDVFRDTNVILEVPGSGDGPRLADVQLARNEVLVDHLR
ncbi:MAG: deoxyribonuclease IV [Acidimicrobiaceae bacterium]|nr:deoxyribonuclease IV [Acidimicrobiaceae bacterium]